MLKKTFKILGIALISLILLLAVFYAFIHFNINGRLEKTYENFPEESFNIPFDAATLAMGQHLAKIKGCQDCHGEDLAGKVVIEDPALGRFVAPNLTSGSGGLPANYSTQDWIRAMRHGVTRENKSFLLMPSEEFTHLTQNDLAAIIAYCKNLEPIDNELPAQELKPLARALIYFDKLPFIIAEKIDHTKTAVPSVDKSDPVRYGQYLSVSCTGCHKQDFKGGDPLIPDSPQTADISSSGNIGNWSEAEFIETLRTGNTPEGKTLQNEYMPWQMTKAYTDEELKSLYAFLSAQP